MRTHIALLLPSLLLASCASAPAKTPSSPGPTTAANTAPTPLPDSATYLGAFTSAGEMRYTFGTEQRVERADASLTDHQVLLSKDTSKRQHYVFIGQCAVFLQGETSPADVVVGNTCTQAFADALDEWRVEAGQVRVDGDSLSLQLTLAPTREGATGQITVTYQGRRTP